MLTRIRRRIFLPVMSIVLPGVVVGEHSLVAAHSSVSRDVEAHSVVGGSPAKFLCPTSKIKLKDGTGRSAYPWTTHFSRGYPEEVVREWLSRIPEVGQN